jgi:nicotinamidase-related amidase
MFIGYMSCMRNVRQQLRRRNLMWITRKSERMIFVLFLALSFVLCSSLSILTNASAAESAGGSVVPCPQSKQVSVDVGTSALVMLHWQNDLVMPQGKLAKHFWKRVQDNKVIEHAKAVLNAARDAGMFVIFVNIGFQPGYPETPPRKYLKGYIAEIVDGKMLLQGSWGAANIDELKPLKEEPIVWNYTASAFEATALERILNNRGIKSLFLSGVATNYVVENTMRAARDKGYQNLILMDSCDAASGELHCWPLANTIGHMAVVTDSANFIDALKKSK